MKYLVVLVVVLGFAYGSEKEDLGLQGLEDVDVESDFSDVMMEEGRQTLDPQLLIGNVFGFLNDLDLNNATALVQAIQDLLKPVGAAGATTGGLLGLGGIKTVFDAIVAGILGLISVPVGIANMILSLVGLVVLIIFLIDGGDFGSLVGVRRSLNVYSLSSYLPDISSYDLVNNPIVSEVSDMFFAAMEKYGN